MICLRGKNHLSKLLQIKWMLIRHSNPKPISVRQYNSIARGLLFLYGKILLLSLNHGTHCKLLVEMVWNEQRNGCYGWNFTSYLRIQHRFLFQPVCFYHAQPLPLSRVHAFKRKKKPSLSLSSASTTEPEKVLGLTSPCLAQ